jgi:sugar lactone lactonase YvrE
MQRSEVFSGWIVSSFLTVGLSAILPNAVWAQSLTLSQTPTVVPITGLDEPLHLAVDPSGNVFVADYNNNTVWKVSAKSQTTVGTGLNQPSGVALDAAGDIFIADSLNNRIVELQGGVQNCLIDGLGYPYAVTVDTAGDVFIADNNQQSVVELLAGGGSSCGGSGGSKKLIGSGWGCPTDVAVDAAGNVFVADPCLNEIVEVVKVPTMGQTIGQLVPIGSGFFNPWGVALDSKGNVFVADSGPNPGQPPLSGHNRVVEVPAGGGPEFTVLSGLNFPSAVTLDTHGDLFISDRLNHRVIELLAAVPNFGNVNVCAGGSCGQTQTLTFNINNNVTVGSISVLTGGVAGADFTLASGSTCTGTLSASSTATISTCTVNVTFAPKYPGLREGSVEILDGSGNVLGSTYVQGTGVGAEVTFSPGAPTTVGTGFQTPQAVAVDAAGNAYIADKSLGAVKAPVGGGALKPAGSGIGNAAGIAVDGAGNVFIVDKANGLVSEVTAVSGTQSTVVSSLSSPSGVAVDGSGNLFIADSGNNRVLEVVAAGGAQVTVGSGFSSPRGVAVDAAGDVFVADTGHNQVIEVPAGGGSPITIASALNAPSGVAVDAAGDVYIADTGNNRIVEVPAGGGTPVVVATGSSLSGPLSVALDAAGDLFIADSGNSRVLELQTSLAPTLTYLPTAQGITSSDSPKSVTVSNIGNAALSFTGLSVGTNFAQVPGSGIPADCSASTSLAPGAACNLSISFTPTAPGPLTSAAVLTDNALGSTAAKQSIALQGQGLTVPTLTFAAIGTQTGGTTLTLSASSNSSSPVTFSSTSSACTVSGNVATFNVAGGTCSITASVAVNANYAAASVTQSFKVLAIPTFTFNTVQGATALGSAMLSATTNSTSPVVFSSTSPSVCTVAGSTVSFLTSGACQLSASVAANSGYAAASATQTVTVGLASQSITFNAIAPQTYGTTLLLNAQASSKLPITYVLVQNGDCTLSNGALTFVNTPLCGVVATQPGNNIYAAAAPVGQVVTVNPAGQTITFGALPNKVQGTTVTLSASASSGLSVNFTSLTPGVCTVSGTSVSTPNAGTCTIQAAQAGNSNYSAAAKVTQSFTVTPAFTLTISSQGQTILPGLFDLVTVQIQSAAGYSGWVTLSCSGGPAGSSCLATPQPVLIVNGCGLQLVSIFVPLGTPNGTYTETFTVTAGSLSDSGTVNFTVKSLF